MIDYYKEEYFTQAKKQKDKFLIIFFVLLAVYIAISATCMVFYLRLPYQSPDITTIKIVHYVITAITGGGLFFYMMVVFKRANKYYKLLRNMKTGIKETSTGSFFEYDETLQEKDGVDCKSLVFLEWNKYKKDIFERKVLVLYDKPFPEFNEKDNVRFITQGNILISYEILD